MKGKKGKKGKGVDDSSPLILNCVTKSNSSTIKPCSSVALKGFQKAR